MLEQGSTTHQIVTKGGNQGCTLRFLYAKSEQKAYMLENERTLQPNIADLRPQALPTVNAGVYSPVLRCSVGRSS